MILKNWRDEPPMTLFVLCNRRNRENRSSHAFQSGRGAIPSMLSVLAKSDDVSK